MIPGRYTLEQISLTSESMKTEYSEEVTVEGPTRLGVSGPGFLHDAALGFVVGGGLVAAAGLLLPLFICESSRSVDSNGQVIGGSVCDRASDGVKVAWIAGAGAGLTLAMVGAVTLLAAPSVPHATVAPWEPPPRSTALGLVPFVLPALSPRDATRGTAVGLAFAATF